MSNVALKRKALAAAVVSALTVPTAATAVESSFYGHANRAIVFGDDGEASDVQFVDSSAHSTRFGWRGSAEMGNGVTAGARIELSTESNLSGATVTLKGGDSNDRQRFRVRQSNVWFSGNWGKLTLGQGPDSLDGVAFADLSGAWLAAENFPDYSAAFRFRDETTGAIAVNAAGSPLVVSHIFQSFDGNRRDLVKYDSPAFGPVTISAFAASNSAWGVMGNLDSELAGGQIWASLGYGSEEAENNQVAPQAQVVSTPGGSKQYLSGSISYKFSQGTNISFAYGQSSAAEQAPNTNVEDADHWYVALGQDWGNNAIRVYYEETDSGEGAANRYAFVIPGCDGESIGVGFNHAIPKPKVDLYTGYANHSADCDVGALANSATGEVQDINVFFVGAKVAFD